MSVEVTNRVWTHSTRKGSDLVLMLALANRADEDGICWPGLQYLADKARVVERQARRMLRQLEAAKEIFTLTGRGRGRTTYYFVTVGLTREQVERVLITRLRMKPLEVVAALEQWLGVGQIKGDADVRFRKGDVPARKRGHAENKTGHPGPKTGRSYVPQDERRDERRETKDTHTRPDAPALPLGQAAERETGVCASSKYSFEQRLAYARNRPGVDNPEGLAMSKRAAAGEFDEAISAWLVEQERPGGAKQRDVSGCPDCFGTGMWYPEGPGRGVTKCRHLRLAGQAEEAEVETVPP